MGLLFYSEASGEGSAKLLLISGCEASEYDPQRLRKRRSRQTGAQVEGPRGSVAAGRRLQRWTQRCDRCRAYETWQKGKGLWILLCAGKPPDGSEQGSEVV